jgi:hypothetical protein
MSRLEAFRYLLTTAEGEEPREHDTEKLKFPRQEVVGMLTFLVMVVSRGNSC